MFTCVPNINACAWMSTVRYTSQLWWFSCGDTEQTDFYSCSSWERTVANKLSLCLTSNGTQLWASSHGLRHVTHPRIRTCGRCCHRYSVCRHSGIHTNVQLFTCPLHCCYQLLDHRSCTRRKVLSWKITNTLPYCRRFVWFAYSTCSFIIFSFYLCCSAMWREPYPADRHYSVPWLSRALPEQPELRMEDHCARGNGNPGMVLLATIKYHFVTFSKSIMNAKHFFKYLLLIKSAFIWSKIQGGKNRNIGKYYYNLK